MKQFGQKDANFKATPTEESYWVAYAGVEAVEPATTSHLGLKLSKKLAR